MLASAGIDYIRIGNEYSADPQCKANLLSEKVKLSPRLGDMKALMAAARVVVGTTSMMAARPFVFDVKEFSLAVVDEASQILEPNIVGLLSAHRKDGEGKERCRIRKFILTGDHKQLPAVVQQDEASSATASPTLHAIHLDNCRGSLFERLIRTERAAGRTEFTGVLRRHGRMHPEVADFPCHEFYHDEHLNPVPLPHQREHTLHYADTGLHDGLDALLRTHRMVFIPSLTCRRPDLSDKVNTDEAATVADVLRRVRLYGGKDRGRDCAVPQPDSRNPQGNRAIGHERA
jgi:hypothetical protein